MEGYGRREGIVGGGCGDGVCVCVCGGIENDDSSPVSTLTHKLTDSPVCSVQAADVPAGAEGGTR